MNKTSIKNFLKNYNEVVADYKHIDGNIYEVTFSQDGASAFELKVRMTSAEIEAAQFGWLDGIVEDWELV